MADSEVRRQPVVVQNFFDAVNEAAVSTGQGRVLTQDAAKSVLSNASVEVPVNVQTLLAKYPESSHAQILDAVRVGSEQYFKEHGVAPDASLIELALHNAVQYSRPLNELVHGAARADVNVRLDNATSAHHDQLSLNPASPIVAILDQFNEAIPFAAYLPADVKSNEAKLAIMQHLAQSDFGGYTAGSSLDGVNAGRDYLNSERTCNLSSNGGAGPFPFTVTAQSSTAVGGVAVSGSNPAAPLLRGRTELYVNGLPAGREAPGYNGSTSTYGTGSNTIAGQVTLANVAYALSGTVNSDTGVISVSSSPALPAGTLLQAVAFIDYEKAPQLAPKIGVDVAVYQMYARPSRGLVDTSLDSLGQMQQELNLDPRGQALAALRNQFEVENHFRALQKMKRIAANYPYTWNYDYTAQIAQKDYSQLWLNLGPVLTLASQIMAIDTIDHGIDILYMTGVLAARVQGLPSTIWQSSGITERPGVYRMGKLFQKYDVYYVPPSWGVVNEAGSGTSSEILAIGRGTSVVRNPIVMGVAVPPIFLPLALNSDMVYRDGFYTRAFATVNPHGLSAKAAALISVINIG